MRRETSRIDSPARLLSRYADPAVKKCHLTPIADPYCCTPDPYCCTPDEEEFWNSVLKGHPDYWQAHNHLGGLLYMRGDFNGAYPHFLRAVQINPQNPESHNNLGLALQKRGDLDGAIEQYKDALKIVDSGVIAANLGDAYEQANKLDDAVEAYRRAIALDGSIAPAHCNLGYVLMQQGEIDEAIKEFRKTVELDPTMPQGKGDLEEALRLKGGKD